MLPASQSPADHIKWVPQQLPLIAKILLNITITAHLTETEKEVEVVKWNATTAV